MVNSLFGDDDQQSVSDSADPGDRSIVPDPDDWKGDKVVGDEPTEKFVISQAVPESMAETTRKSGLAWSAGIVFFGSVVFMLVLGWFADLLLGSSPWGIVGGIILGSIIGFVQFFRITSQIFGAPKSEETKSTLFRDDD